MNGSPPALRISTDDHASDIKKSAGKWHLDTVMSPPLPLKSSSPDKLESVQVPDTADSKNTASVDEEDHPSNENCEVE